jgi:hypothetical protein
MKPLAAVVAGALISGVTMYTVGARTATVDAFTPPTSMVQNVEGRYVAPPAPATPARTLRSPAPARVSTAAAPRRTVDREVAPASPAPVPVERAQPQRSWQKTVLIVGGSAASGAGVGALVHGKKGALVGAAIGGGAASIYEAIRR